MNNLLRIKLKFTPESKPRAPVEKNLTSNRFVDLDKIDNLIENLNSIKLYYASKKQVVKKAIIDVYYNDIIAKSNRIGELLKGDGSIDKTIVGARFSDAENGEENHIITHYIDFQDIDGTIEKLNVVKDFLLNRLSGEARKDNFNKPASVIDYSGYTYDEKKLRTLIVDCSVVEKFDIPNFAIPLDKESILVTFYKTELKVSDLFTKIGITSRYTPYGDNSISVDIETLKKIQEEIPYMVSMIASDLSIIQPSDVRLLEKDDVPHITEPLNEPTIGVIDTLFDKKVYFSNWVQYEEVLEFYEKTNIREEDYYHGTEVSSIIVDGPTLNPELQDNCGRFRVKHFGVCTNRISPALLIRKIKKIVDDNPQIHVWNLSLGTDDEVSKNFISYDAAILDEIQATRNVIFVISGTNDNNPKIGQRIRIGSPADSLNSIVVNSVKKDNTPCSYSRKGTVLSFFNKPDVSYYGGDIKEKISVYSPKGIVLEMGTSFAAPWISRKLCYLIDILGLPKEVAKALIIDSAAGWEYKQFGYKNKDLIGFGVVPIKINDILASPNNEIRFLVYETSKSYKTANYSIPVPKSSDGKYPFIARATLCYFPKCRREQGVDYTDRELSLKFGRVDKSGKIVDINKNIQDDTDGFATERKSRQDFRKWENTKFISSLFHKNRSLSSTEDKLWGFCVTSKERIAIPKKEKMNFGAVVTLREINNVNRINEFKHACLLRGYIVTELEVSNQIDIYETSQQDIIFDQ